jgi:hypothetical protein
MQAGAPVAQIAPTSTSAEGSETAPHGAQPPQSRIPRWDFDDTRLPVPAKGLSASRSNTKSVRSRLPSAPTAVKPAGRRQLQSPIINVGDIETYTPIKSSGASTWDVDAVAAWIEEMLPGDGHKHIVKAAIEAKIDGKTLLQMNEAAWAELGVSSALFRSRLIAHALSATTAPQPRAPRHSEKSVLKHRPMLRQYVVPRRAIARRTAEGADAQKLAEGLKAEATHLELSESAILQRVLSRANVQPPERSFEVKCRCVVQNLYIKVLENQTFEAYLKFEASWEDPSPVLDSLYQADFDLNERIVESQADGQLEAPCKVRLIDGTVEQLFRPRITFKNLIEIKPGAYHKEWYHLKQWRASKPTVKWNALFTGVFHVQANLRLFPFGEQLLTIEVQAGWELQPSGKAEKKHPWEQYGVCLRKNAEAPSVISLGTTSSAVRNQYTLFPELLFDRDESDPNDSSSSCVYSKLLISMHVQRKAGFFFFNIMFPNFMITASALASYGEPASDLGGRLQITVTVLLALTSELPHPCSLLSYLLADRQTPELLSSCGSLQVCGGGQTPPYPLRDIDGWLRAQFVHFCIRYHHCAAARKARKIRGDAVCVVVERDDRRT